MAKTYSATIQLKDANAINTLKKISEAAKSLQKELKAISKTPISINAKLGSSFKNAEANINRITPKSKTIKIEATENVTKTMNQVQRQMFEMSNKMNSTINSSMKGFNSRLSASLPKLQAMSNTMAALANTSKLMNSVAGASALAGAGAGLAGAAALRKNKNIMPVSNSQRKQLAKELEKYRKRYEPKGIFESLTSGFKSGFSEDAYNTRLDNKELKITGKIEFDDSEVTEEFERVTQKFSNPRNLRVVDDAFGSIIERQKSNMAKLGNFDYLKKYEKLQGDKTDFGFFNVSKANKDISLFQKVSDAFRDKIKGMQSYIDTLTFSPAYQKMKSGAATAFNFIKRTGLGAYYAVERSAYKVGRVAGTVTKAFSTSWQYIKNSATSSFSQINKSGANMASRFGSYFIRTGSNIYRVLRAAFTKVKTSSDGTARRVPRAWVSAAGSIAKTIVSVIGGAFNKVKSMAMGAVKAIAAASVAAIGVGVKDMASQEQYLASMTHFISVDDAKANGTNTITKEQAKERANGLFDWGTEFAKVTPFDTNEIYSSINRMTQIFGYGEDGSQIKKMVKLVGDMSALNPGKSMSDAAEAIADLAMGETERMKEFGFKISQDELKALAGVPDQTDSLTNDQLLTAFEKMTSSGGALFETFDGGADALAGTLAGKWSTFTGQFRQMMADAVKPFEGMLKDSLQKAIDFLDGDFATRFTDTFSNIATFVGDLMAGDSSNFPIIENIINAFNRLKESVGPILDTISEQYRKISDSASESFGGMGGIIEGAANVIAGALDRFAPFLELISPIFNTIKETAIAVWPVVQGVIDIAAQVIKDVVEKLQPVFDAVDQVIKLVGDTVQDIWPKIQETILNVWENLQPALDLFASLCQLVADIFEVAWPPISGILETLWEVASPILEGLAEILGTVCGWLDKAAEGFSNVLQKAKDSSWNPFNWFGGDKEDGSNAYGLERVPFDGYKAVLHEGERVLTAREAREVDRGTNNATTNNTITVNVNGARDARSVANEVVRELKAIIPNMA